MTWRHLGSTLDKLDKVTESISMQPGGFWWLSQEMCNLLKLLSDVKLLGLQLLWSQLSVESANGLPICSRSRQFQLNHD